MEKATGCSSLSVNIHQKKRVRFFLDTVGWEGGLLKLQSLPCPAGKVLPWAGGSRRCLDEPLCSFLPVLSSPASAPSSSLQTCCLVFGLCCCSEWARGCCQSPRGPVGSCMPETPLPQAGCLSVERRGACSLCLPAWGSGRVMRRSAKGIWDFKLSQVRLVMP